MSEDHSTRFPKLNDANYIEWSIRMEAELIRRGLWGMVEVVVDEEGKDAATIESERQSKKSKRSAQKMSEARAEMILRVDDGQLSHMRSRDPMEIWEMLHSVHRARGFATSLALRRKFLTAKKAPTQSMQAWIGSIRAQAFVMEETGIAVSVIDMILALTMGLPQSYQAVIINFDATPTEQLTFTNVVARLLNEENRQAGMMPDVFEPTVKDEPTIQDIPRNAAMSAITARHTSRPEVTCHFCDKKGHFKAECRERQKWEDSKKDEANVAMSATDVDPDTDGVW